MTDPTTPTPPATEGQAGSEELIPGRDFCPLDGEPLKMVIQAKGKPTLYIHADGFTWHPDASEQIKIRPVADILSQLRSGSPQHLTRPELPEHYVQPPAPVSDTAEVLAGLRESMSRAVNRSEAIALVEAAQARLTDPVRGGGSDG